MWQVRAPEKCGFVDLHGVAGSNFLVSFKEVPAVPLCSVCHCVILPAQRVSVTGRNVDLSSAELMFVHGQLFATLVPLLNFSLYELTQGL